jgi:hypothetical protein
MATKALAARLPSSSMLSATPWEAARAAVLAVALPVVVWLLLVLLRCLACACSSGHQVPVGG